MKTPLIFDIKRCAFEDGPGIRTTVFFKGCNMDCFWCHNPEGKRPEVQAAYFEEKCLHCGACAEGPAEEVCPAQARKRYGRIYSAEELMAVILADRDYYRASGGGVTFSGGECMLWPEYLAELARRCREQEISVAVDTAGNVPWSAFLQVIPWTDLFLYDIKCLDPGLHRRGTGADNGLILQNLERLLETGKEIRIRTPLIPGFNEVAEAERVQEFCRLRGLPWEGLAYHTFGEAKKKALI